MPFTAKCVANEFLRIAQEKGEALTPMKLQKLVYFAHGWCLALTGKPLISDQIEAWQYGPVIPALYQEFKSYGNDAITSRSSEFKMDGGKFRMSSPTLDDYEDSTEAETAKQIIAKVFDEYGRYTAVKLSNSTHVIGSPWEQVYKGGVSHILIPNDTIKTYFESLVRVAHAGK